MVSLKWCCEKKDGIILIEPNDNLAQSYLKMAEDALGTMNREKYYNSIFAISACYYSMYYSLYAILMRFGIKCEIHACTLELMKSLLLRYYSNEEMQTIKKAFDARNIVQYYANKFVSKEDSEFIMNRAVFFISKSKEILSIINEKNINETREKIRKLV